MISWVKDIHNTIDESGPSMGPKGAAWARRTLQWFRAFGQSFGVEVTAKINHYEVWGFLYYNSQYWYFNTGDARWNFMDSMLIRTAKDQKDFRGGGNQYIRYDEDFQENLIQKLGIR